MNMKASLLFALLSLASSSFSSVILKNEDQYYAQFRNHPGFNLNLDDLRLVQTSSADRPVWMTELQKIQAKAQGINVMDICPSRLTCCETETPDLGSTALLRSSNKFSFPAPNATKSVEHVIKNLTTDGMRSNLKEFTGFTTRYYRSESGKQSQQWLLSKIAEITAAEASANIRDLISISEFPHSWGQNSIILKIKGSDSLTDASVIIGAHQDSANSWPFLPAPGADDDGSGTMSILEAYRGLISAGFAPRRTVEFHWYSAEEGGLLGSQAVAQDYERRGANVLAMSQFDMTAWVKRGTKESVGIITDYTDNELTEFNKKLVDAYLSIPYVETKCGYACSDHASWSKAGYQSSFTIESRFEDSNQLIHSVRDRIDISDEFSFDHMLEFSKLAVAYAIELGGWDIE